MFSTAIISSSRAEGERNRLVTLAALLAFVVALSACGSNCPAKIPLSVAPANATADHTAGTPGNQIQFSVMAPTAGKGCSSNEVLSIPVWTSSDPADVQFSSTTNGLATCVNATPGAATVTVTADFGVQQGTGNAQLTCK